MVSECHGDTRCPIEFQLNLWDLWGKVITTIAEHCLNNSKTIFGFEISVAPDTLAMLVWYQIS